MGSNPIARSIFMVVTVYVLSFDDGSSYVGMTKDMDRRLGEHERRQSVSTRKHKGPFRVIYTKVFQDHASARKHEVFLKSGAGRKFLGEFVKGKTARV